MKMLEKITKFLFASLMMMAFVVMAHAQDKLSDYKLGAGDAIRILVFQNPDMTLETRVSEGGTITYPLIGSVRIGGVTISEAEKVIASALRSGGFVQQPQVNIVLLQVRGNQVSVLGEVNHPGRFPLETSNVRVSETLGMAGGIAATGSQKIVVTGTRNDKSFRKEIDVEAMFLDKGGLEDIIVAGGDVVFVPRAPVFYIYGEAQRPGSYRVERNMTFRQAIAQGGGPTPRGTDSSFRVDRKGLDGKVTRLKPEKDEFVQPEDVIYLRESIF